MVGDLGYGFCTLDLIHGTTHCVIKATDWDFTVTLKNHFESVDEILLSYTWVTAQTTPTEQYFPVKLGKVVLTFESVGEILGVTFQMKGTEQYFPVILFIMLYKLVLTFESMDEILGVTFQMKGTEQYFPVILFIMLYKVVLTFESVDELLMCDHSNESYWTVLSYGTCQLCCTR